MENLLRLAKYLYQVICVDSRSGAALPDRVLRFSVCSENTLCYNKEKILKILKKIKPTVIKIVLMG